MRYSRTVLAGIIVASLAATGCTANTRGGDGAGSAARSVEIVQDVRGEARTPAPEVDGAQNGGAIHILMAHDFEHLDPAAVYVSVEQLTSTQLIHRTLTSYIEDPDGDRLRLVGDLATNTGVSADGGRRWTYTLRDGISFDDGTPITSKDVAYGIARSFSSLGDPGPTYFRDWLQPDGDYRGPYDGGADLPPGVATPDDKTIVFTFPEPHPDLPLAAALPTTAPVPKAKDTREAYDTTFVASGPYKLQAGSYRRGESMVLVRNEQWRPESDPIRHQYPDEFRFSFDVPDADQTLRLLSDDGEDRTAVSVDGVPVELVAQVRNDPDVQRRVIQGETPYALYIHINTQRVKDVDVRRALNLAFNRDAYVKARGGLLSGAPSTTISSPTLPGYTKYDAYPAPPTGDPDKAKELLAGKKVPPLNYCFANTPNNQRIAAGVKAGIERAGVTVNLQPTDGASYNAVTGDRRTTCDLIVGSWGMDYPDARTVFEPLLHGDLSESGNTNLSYFADPEVDARLDELAAEPDRAKAAKGYAALDREVMAEHAPLIPAAYERFYGLIGSTVGGAHLTPLYGQTAYVNMYVT